MSRLVAQFDPSPGSGSFQAGAVNRCSTLWVMNESPNFIKLDFSAADTPKIVQPWYNKKLTLTNPVQTVNWSVVATLLSDSPPVSLVFVELYDPSEDTSALLSGPLQRQTNVGNNITVADATTLTNTEQAAGTVVIDLNSTGSVNNHNVVVENDGTAHIAVQSATADAVDIVSIVPGDASNVASINLGVSNNSTTSIQGADISTQRPLRLFTSYQETGYASGAGVAAAGGDAWAFPINFKTVLTNVPTITLNPSSSGNCSAAANNVSKYGFSLVLTATAAGSFFWVGSYTTVGN